MPSSIEAADPLSGPAAPSSIRCSATGPYGPSATQEVETKSPDLREEMVTAVIPAWSAEKTVALEHEDLGLPMSNPSPVRDTGGRPPYASGISIPWSP